MSRGFPVGKPLQISEVSRDVFANIERNQYLNTFFFNFNFAFSIFMITNTYFY